MSFPCPTAPTAAHSSAIPNSTTLPTSSVTSASPSPSSTDTYQTTLSSLLPPQAQHVPLSLPISPHALLIPSHRIASLSVHPVLEAALHILNLDLPSAHFLLRHMQAPPAWEAMYLHGVLHRVEGDLANARAWYGDVRESVVFQAVWGDDRGMGGGLEGEGEGESGREEKCANVCSTRSMSTASGPPHVLSNTANSDSNVSTANQHSSAAGPDTNPKPRAFQNAMSFLDQVEAYKLHLVGSSKSRPPSSTTNATKPADSSSSTPLTEAYLRSASLHELVRILSFCETKFGMEPVTDASGSWVSMAEKHKDKAAEMITGGEGWREF